MSSSFSYYSSLYSSFSGCPCLGLLFHSLAPLGCPLLSFLFSDFVLCLSFAQLRFHGFLVLLWLVLYCVYSCLLFFYFALYLSSSGCHRSWSPVPFLGSSWLSLFVFCFLSSGLYLCLSFALLRFPGLLILLWLVWYCVYYWFSSSSSSFFLVFVLRFSFSSSAPAPGNCFACFFVFFCCDQDFVR